MAYTVCFDGMPMPVTPSKIEMKIKNQNKTLNLIDGSEINIQKAPGLTEFSFELMIPQIKGYPFAFYPDEIINGKHEKTEFIGAQYYLDLFQRLKTEKPYFQFDIKRTSPAGDVLFDTQMNTSLEEYSVTEDSENGLDLTVAVNLKQYRNYSAVVYTIGKDNRLIITHNSTQKTVPKPYTVKQGDTLWAICQKYLNDGSKYLLIAKLNGIKDPNLIRAGQVIRFG